MRAPLASLLLLLLAVGASLGHGHSHDGEDDHGHSHGGEDDNPAWKYSRSANIVEDEILEEDIVDVPAGFSNEKPKSTHDHHGHSHEDHGHSHGGHGHDHGSHGHSHGGHGHSHGAPQREPTAEEREKHRQRLHKIWDEDEEDEAHGDRKSHVWLYALSSTLAISLAPFAILFFINLDNSKENQGPLKILLSFASGGLLGDAFLHLIPHAIMAQEGHSHSHGGHSHGGHEGHSHGGSHNHAHGGEEEEHVHDLTVGLGVLGGILAFLVVEKVVRIYSGGHGHSHGESASAGKADLKDKKKEDNKGAKGDSSGKSPKKKAKQSDAEESDKEEEKKEEEEGKEKKDAARKDTKEKKCPAKVTEHQEEVRVAGYLNLFADFFHNFTDGLAIGASFLAGRNIGFVTTVTILFHEIPHEIGDYAILIQSGVKPFRAKCLQLLTALGAFAGCVVSLFAGGLGDAVTAYILPFTAGGFIYIATVSVIPELLEGSTLKQSLKEIVALLVGVLMMVIIAKYE